MKNLDPNSVSPPPLHSFVFPLLVFVRKTFLLRQERGGGQKFSIKFPLFSLMEIFFPFLLMLMRSPALAKNILPLRPATVTVNGFSASSKFRSVGINGQVFAPKALAASKFLSPVQFCWKITFRRWLPRETIN